MSLRAKIGLLLTAMRAPFLFASAIPVLLGAAVAWADVGRLQPYLLLESLVGCLALHAGANVANEYYDWRSGADGLGWHSPYNGGSRLLPSGKITPRQERRLYRCLYVLAALIGLDISRRVGPLALLLGLLGLACGHWYTAPPLAFSYRGLGELVTGVTFGPLLVSGAYFVQAGRLSWWPVVVALPVGLLITAVLYINEFPDYLSDRAAGKLTWVVRTDAQQMGVYQWLVGAAMLAAFLLFHRQGGWPQWLALPLSALACRSLFAASRLDSARISKLQQSTLLLHACTGLGLTFTYLVAGWR